LAANGADIIAVDIAGKVSPASNAVPATPEELDESSYRWQAALQRKQDSRQ
jgi:hypothetical protein